mmetsp:Transcript_541/g.1218  ORF Transcript_541/g.1218 Transcript_541/m.1218 type:complete len:117 (-) Transcript_541:742-1092(-)
MRMRLFCLTIDEQAMNSALVDAIVWGHVAYTSKEDVRGDLGYVAHFATINTRIRFNLLSETGVLRSRLEQLPPYRIEFEVVEFIFVRNSRRAFLEFLSTAGQLRFSFKPLFGRDIG